MAVKNNVDQTLAQLEDWGREHDVREPDHSKKMLNLEPDTARLLSILIQNGRRTRLLEIGTSNGYSTIWLARAVRRTGGHIESIDHSPTKQAMADANLRRAGLRELVTLRNGDAGAVLEQLDGPFDFVFLDADRRQYPSYLPALLSRLTPGALLLADNVHSHPQEIAPYLEAISVLPEFEHIVVGVGKGLSIACRREGIEE